MRLNDMDVLISKVESKTNKEGVSYIQISFLDLSSGDNFQVISKEIDYMKLKPMCKYRVSLNLLSSKYGLKLELNSVSKEMGSI